MGGYGHVPSREFGDRPGFAGPADQAQGGAHQHRVHAGEILDARTAVVATAKRRGVFRLWWAKDAPAASLPELHALLSGRETENFDAQNRNRRRRARPSLPRPKPQLIFAPR